MRRLRSRSHPLFYAVPISSVACSPSDGGYYAYATNGGGSNVQTAFSSNLAEWTAGDDALPLLPAWARAGRTWAPAVAPLAGMPPLVSSLGRRTGRAVARQPGSSVFGTLAGT